MRHTRAACLAGFAGLFAMVLAAADASAAGLLVPRSGGSPIGIESHRVTVGVDDGLALTTVRQVFVSDREEMSEAIYLFPVPDGASLVDVSMEAGGQRLEGMLVERKRGRRVYDDIVRGRRDPALVEQVGRNAFRMSVFPIEKGKPVVVEVTYVQWVPLLGGELRYVYPLASEGEAARTEKDFTITVRMRSSAPIVSFEGSRDLDVVRAGPRELVASLERTGALLDEDVVLAGRVETREPSLAVSTFRAADGDGIFLAVITPPEVPEDRLVPRDVVLVLDASGSMEGEKIEQAKASARWLLDHLRPTDRLNVVRFSSTARAFADAPVPVTAENRESLRAFVDGIAARGGTNVEEALVLAGRGATAAGRVRTVVLLSDGQPTIGETAPAALVALARGIGDAGARIFPFGVGEDADAGLLRGFALAGRGRAEVFRPGGEIESRLTGFLRRTASPVLTDVKLEVEGVRVHDLHPRPLPDAYLGEQLVVAGRYEGSGAAVVRASAVLGDRRVALPASVAFPAEPGGAPAVRYAFARMKLDWLVEQVRLRQGLDDDAWFAAVDRGAYSTSDEIVEEAILTSLEHGVACPYTSWLVLLPEDRERIDPRAAAALERKPGDPVVRDAKVADHDETDSDLPFEESLGKDGFLSDAPFEGPRTGAAIGVGGGVGGAYGGRGGHRNLRAEGGGKETEQALDLGLEWLMRHQNEDGSFSEEPDRVGDTALAVLAYLGAGETHKHGRHRNTVKSALRYLKQVQGADGRFGTATGPAGDRATAMAALAMAEAFGLTGSPLFKQSAQSGVDHLGRLRPDDPSVAPWAGAAIYAAGMARLRVPEGELARYREIAEKMSDASAVLIRIFGGEDPRTSTAIREAVERLVAAPPEWGVTDLETLYFGTLSAFQVGGDPWKTWNRALREALLPSQAKDADAAGSWDPPADAGTRVRTTALLTMCVEVYYRYGRVFGTK